MRPKLNLASARRAALSMACALVAALSLFIAPTRAQQQTPAQTAVQAESARPAAPAADAYVGAWEAMLPSGPRVATLMIVSDGAGGYAGALVGYEYDRSVDPMPAGTPKVAMRWGSLLKDVRLEASTMSFKVTLRPPSPPQGMPASIEINCEVRFVGGDTAELRLSHPRKPEPLVLKLVRE
jgi:hypothetical protein